MRLSHCPTVALPHCRTVPLSHCPTVALSYRSPDIVRETDPEAVARVLRLVCIAEAAPRAAAVELPAPAADDSILARARAHGIGGGPLGVETVPVLYPLPDVTGQVEEAH